MYTLENFRSDGEEFSKEMCGQIKLLGKDLNEDHDEYDEYTCYPHYDSYGYNAQLNFADIYLTHQVHHHKERSIAWMKHSLDLRAVESYLSYRWKKDLNVGNKRIEIIWLC